MKWLRKFLFRKKKYMEHKKVQKGTRCVRCGLAKGYWNTWHCIEVK